MKQLICEMCGGRIKVNSGGIVKCDSCGLEYSMERIREKVQEIKGTIHVDNAHLIDNFYEMAKDSFEVQNYRKSIEYCDRIIEVDRSNIKAHFLKGKAFGRLCVAENELLDDMIVSFCNYVNYAESEAKKMENSFNVQKELEVICTALIKECICNDDFNEKVVEKFEKILNQFSLILTLFSSRTGVLLNTNCIYGNISNLIRGYAYSEHNKHLSNYNAEKSRENYFLYVDNMNTLFPVLEKTVDLCSNDDELDMKLYDLIILILNTELNNNETDFIETRWGTWTEKERLGIDQVDKIKKQIRKFTLLKNEKRK